MASHSEAWKQQLENKISSIRTKTWGYVATPDPAIANQILGETDGLNAMFHTVPSQVGRFRSIFQQYSVDKSGAILSALVDAHRALTRAAEFSDNRLPTFDEIFATYKADSDLKGLTDQLLDTLRKLIEEGDDQLSAQLHRELSEILKQLSRKEALSLYEMQSWTDLAMKVLIRIAEFKSGWIGVTLAYEGAKIAYKVRKNLMGAYEKAQLELAKQHGLSGVERSLAANPQLPNTEEELKALLPHEPKPPTETPR